MKKILLALCVPLGCSNDYPKAAPKVPTERAITVESKTKLADYTYVYVIRHHDTGKKFIIVDGSREIAMCPL